MEWIRCTDRLPEKEGRYLVVLKSDRTCFINDKPVHRWVSASNFTIKKGWMSHTDTIVETHWARAPELPQEVE